MKTAGIVAEYNPFHNGHLYQLKKTKEETGADFIVIVMSGDFVQRGFPAFLSKWERVKMALSCGADLVVELPTRYATASAEFFAAGAIALLENTGTDCFCFGSESGDIRSMEKIADYIHKDCDDFNKAIAQFTKSGLSYPAARSQALLSCFPKNEVSDLSSLLSSPNNILGIEYLKALYRFQSKMTPYTIQRVCTGYHEADISSASKEQMIINSATAIRNAVQTENNLDPIRQSMPLSALEVLENLPSDLFPISPDALSDFLFYKLQTTSPEQLTEYMDISPDLARTIFNKRNNFENFTQFSQLLKSRQLTQTRINRALLHLILNLKNYTLKGLTAKETVPYVRVLGFRKSAACIMKRAKENGIPVITKLADAKILLSKSAYDMLSEDLFASALYKRLVFSQSGIHLPNEFQKTPIIF